MIQQQDIVQTLEAKSLSGLTLLPQQLATILDIDEETLSYMKKCWGFGYVFTKNEANKWLIAKDVFVEEEWFIEASGIAL